MTRYHTLTVVLEHDFKDEDADALMDAIRHIRGVLSVDGVVADFDSHMAEARAKSDLGQKLWEVIYPKDK